MFIKILIYAIFSEIKVWKVGQISIINKLIANILQDNKIIINESE